MTPLDVVHIGQEALYTMVMLSAPIMLTILLTGLLIGLFQAATQINEMTLTFVPKILALAAVFFIAGPWMLRFMMEYTTNLFTNLPNLIG
jgi:flagellar biosynthetic protein FliQ